MRRLAIFIGLILLSTLSRAETVRLASGEWAPYLSPALPNHGPVSQLVSEAFALQGLTVEYAFLPWRRGYEEARDGQFDATLVWSSTPERERDFLYSAPVIELQTMLFHRKDTPFDWHHVEDLEGLRIGGVIGYSYAVEQAERDGRIRIDRIAEPANNYRKLAADRLDLVAEDQAVGSRLIEQLSLSTLITYHPRPLKRVTYHVLISRRTGRGEALIKAFNAGLASLKASGRYNEILGTLQHAEPVPSSTATD